MVYTLLTNPRVAPFLVHPYLLIIMSPIGLFFSFCRMQWQSFLSSALVEVRCTRYLTFKRLLFRHRNKMYIEYTLYEKNINPRSFIFAFLLKNQNADWLGFKIPNHFYIIFMVCLLLKTQCRAFFRSRFSYFLRLGCHVAL